MQTSQPERYYELDFMRFIAAVSVVLYHYFFYGYFDKDLPLLFTHLGPLFQFGYLGVQLFFIISGFVIFQSALGKKPFLFLYARACRLYPAYWFCCTITFLVVFFGGAVSLKVGIFDYLVNMTMLSRFARVPYVEGAYWTLTYELIFYCVIATLLYFKALKNIIRYCFMFLLFSIASLIFLNITHVQVPYFVVEFPLILYGPYFCAGILFYLIKKEGLTAGKLGLILLSYLGSVLQLIYTNFDEVSVAQERDFANLMTIGLVSLIYLIFFLFSLDQLKFLRLKAFKLPGAITYPLYLIHQKVGYVLIILGMPWLEKHVLVVLTCILMLILSYGCHQWVELPLQSLMKQLRKMPKSTEPLRVN